MILSHTKREPVRLCHHISGRMVESNKAIKHAQKLMLPATAVTGLTTLSHQLVHDMLRYSLLAFFSFSAVS